jgi:hypothetical protein
MDKKMYNKIYFFKSSLLLMALGLFFFTSCKPQLLPSTNVLATRENKSIVEFLEKYKTAVEKRSIDAIMEFVAKDYSDNMGSENPALHVDYLKLKEKLEKTLPRIQDIRLGMFVQHISKLDKNIYEVVFYFNKHILMEVPSGEKWVSIKDVNRMVIRERHDKDSSYKYEILQGL